MNKEIDYNKSMAFWTQDFLGGLGMGKYAGYLISKNEEVIGKYRFEHELTLLEEHSVFGGAFLDLGCGTGNYLYAWRKRFGKLIGIDISPSMISLARRMCRKEKNIRVIRGDIRNIEKLVPSRLRYKLIFIGGCLMYLHDKDAVIVLKKLLTRLEPEGILIFREPTAKKRIIVEKKLYTCVGRKVSNYFDIIQSADKRAKIQTHQNYWVNYVYYLGIYIKWFPVLKKVIWVFSLPPIEFLFLKIPYIIVSIFRRNPVSYHFFIVKH